MQPAAFISRFAPVGVAVAGVGLALAIALGAVAVPDMAGAVDDATRSLGAWVYLAVLLLIFLETTALVGFVIHGELALLVGGIAAERGDVSLAAILLLATVAAVAGDVCSFLLGGRLGRPFLEAHGPRVRFGPERLAKVETFFARHGGKAVLLGRFTGFLRATLPFVAGTSNMPLRRLIAFGVPSALAWVAAFTVIGYVASEPLEGAGETATRVALVGVLLAFAAIALRARLRPGA